MNLMIIIYLQCFAGLNKKDIKAEHKLPNGLTSQIKHSNGTSKLPSNGTPEISANGTFGSSSHEQRIPNGSLPSHTTIPPPSPKTTVLPPAFMPSQGFTAEDKVNERVTLKSWDPVSSTGRARGRRQMLILNAWGCL